MNSLRPDKYIEWYFRVPRILWEFCVVVVCMTASSSPASSVWMLLSIMLGSTAMTDTFFWAPFFAMYMGYAGSEMESYGRFLVSIQALVTGLIYMYTAIEAWKTAMITWGLEYERR